MIPRVIILGFKSENVMKRTIRQREAYSFKRMITAIDRFIQVESSGDRAQANKWIKAWSDRYRQFVLNKKYSLSTDKNDQLNLF